jgi:hypothetical protein
MSTTSNILKSSLIAASLLLAGAAYAGDATSDRAPAASSAKPGAVENRQISGGAQSAEAKACRCATSAPRGVLEKSLLDDPNFTGYSAG